MTRIDVNIETASQEYFTHFVIEIVQRIMMGETCHAVVIVILDLYVVVVVVIFPAHFDSVISTVSSVVQSCVDVIVYGYYKFIDIDKRKPIIFIFMFLIAFVIYFYL